MRVRRFLLSLDGVADDLDLAAHSGGTALMFAAAGGASTSVPAQERACDVARIGHEAALRLLVDAGGEVDRRVVGTADYVAQAHTSQRLPHVRVATHGYRLPRSSRREKQTSSRTRTT